MSIATTSRPATGGMGVSRSAPRRRSLMQGALAVLLIVAGALTAGYVAQRMGSTHDFLGVAKPIGQGGCWCGSWDRTARRWRAQIAKFHARRSSAI